MAQLLSLTQRVLLFDIWQLVETFVTQTSTQRQTLITMMVLALVTQCTASVQVKALS